MLAKVTIRGGRLSVTLGSSRIEQFFGWMDKPLNIKEIVCFFAFSPKQVFNTLKGWLKGRYACQGVLILLNGGVERNSSTGIRPSCSIGNGQK